MRTVAKAKKGWKWWQKERVSEKQSRKESVGAVRKAMEEKCGRVAQQRDVRRVRVGETEKGRGAEGGGKGSWQGDEGWW